MTTPSLISSKLRLIWFEFSTIRPFSCADHLTDSYSIVVHFEPRQDDLKRAGIFLLNIKNHNKFTKARYEAIR